MTLSADLRRNEAFYLNLDRFEGVAFYSDCGSITYAELEKRVSVQAMELQDACEDCLAALCFETSIDAVVNYLAALRSETPLLVIDPDLPVAQQEALYAKLGVSVALAGLAIVPVARWPFKHKLQKSSEKLHYAAVLLSTSGSSGSPKSVMLSRQNLLANTDSILRYLPIRSDDCAITTLPLHYSFGLSVLNTHLAVGARMVLTTHPMMSREFWQQVREHQVSSLSGVPFHFEMLKMLRLERMELPAIRYLTQAGGRLDPKLVSHFANVAEQQDWQFYVMYGQTEATARMAYVPHDQIQHYPDIIGQAIPGGRFEIHDFELADVNSESVITEPLREGELWYFGDNVMLGYAEQPSDWQQGHFPRKSLATGDIACYTEQGMVKITGRLSRFIKVRGKRVQLDHLEQQLSALGSKVYCCGNDDVLFVAHVNEEHGLSEQISSVLRAELLLHPTLFNVVQLETLPTLSSGKVDYVKLLAICQQSNLAANKEAGE
ncbi:AMP-binding protein [Aliidiomarina celeris]|uniref:AMP-binding protein n=1 Tax=Aliidiomarina celeris TaxID=2249428 RepID=UPI000DEAE878|nr:AMP-binding protein [Aliidiomarina celeris]